MRWPGNAARKSSCLGDYLGELAYPEKTLDLLDQVRKEFPCTFIRGNKEDYWIDRQKGLNPDWIREAGSSSTGIQNWRNVPEKYWNLALDEFGTLTKQPEQESLPYDSLP